MTETARMFKGQFTLKHRRQVAFELFVKENRLIFATGALEEQV